MSPIRWNDATQTLSLGELTGKFTGMPKHIDFRVVLVNNGHGAGEEVTANADAVVDHTGQKAELTFAPKSSGRCVFFQRGRAFFTS